MIKKKLISKKFLNNICKAYIAYFNSLANK